MAQRRSAAPTPIELAPVVLIKSGEPLLADRIMRKLRALAYEADPQTERTDISAATYEAGQLDILTSPSLFGEARLLIIPDLELMSDALLMDLLAYIAAPAPDVWLFAQHNGGMRGKKLLEAMSKAKVPTHVVEKISRDKDKLQFVLNDVRQAGRKIDTAAAQMLVDAQGAQLPALAAAVSQLLADISGVITVDDVHRYYAGRIEATGFEVADAAISGQSAKALTLFRHALATGVDPVPMVAALALKLRQMAKVSLPDGRNLVMSPWQAEQARRSLREWDDEGLARAIQAVALADEEVKGLSKNPEYAVEKCILSIIRARRG